MAAKSIAGLDRLNLLAVYDVLLDLQQEFNIAPPAAPVSIPLFGVCRFRELGERDDYGRRKAKILRYLMDHAVIDKFLLEDPHDRFQSRFTVSSDPVRINNTVDVVAAEYQRRSPHGTSASRKAGLGTKIFIGHGRSSAWKDLQSFITDRLKLDCTEFNSESTAGVSTKGRLEEMLDESGFAFLVFTAEDERPDGTRHARDNVIHECGLFQGRLGFKRAIVLLEQGCADFSNIYGLTHIEFPSGKIRAAYEEIRLVLEREDVLQKS